MRSATHVAHEKEEKTSLLRGGGRRGHGDLGTKSVCDAEGRIYSRPRISRTHFGSAGEVWRGRMHDGMGQRGAAVAGRKSEATLRRGNRGVNKNVGWDGIGGALILQPASCSCRTRTTVYLELNPFLALALPAAATAVTNSPPYCRKLESHKSHRLSDLRGV